MCDLLVLAPAVHGGGVRDSEWQLNELVTEDQPRQPRGQEGLVSGLPATSTLQIKITPHMFPQPRDGEAKHRGVGEGELDVGELGPELVTRDQEGHLQGGTGHSWSAGVTAATWNLGWSSVILILTLCSFWISMVSHSLSTSPPYMLGCGVRTRCTNQLPGICHSNIFQVTKIYFSYQHRTLPRSPRALPPSCSRSPAGSSTRGRPPPKPRPSHTRKHI